MESGRPSIMVYGFIFLCILFGFFIIAIVVSGNRVVSPVPDEGAIKIIYITPSDSPTSTAVPTGK